MAPSEERPGLSEETISVIEGQVKKGKTRKFFMITKGASIQTVGVFKKGQFGPKIMEAKKSGFKGEVSYGVVSGTGKNLIFQFAGNQAVAEAMKVDSFVDSVPVKDIKVKEFFSDNGVEVKPELQCISVVADALVPGAGEEDEEGNTGGAGQTATAEPTPSTESSVPTAEQSTNAGSASNEFATRLKAIKPDIDRVLQAGVAVSSQLKLAVGQAAGFAREQQFDAALQEIGTVESLVQQGLQQIGAGAGPEADPSGMKAKLEEALRNLVPKLKQAVADFPDKKSELLSPVAVIKQQLEQGLLNEAKQGILAVGGLLKELASNATSNKDAGTQSGAGAQQYQEMLDGILPRYNQVAAGKLEGADKLEKLMQMAQSKAQAGDYSTALRALEGLVKGIDAALVSATPKTDGEQAAAPQVSLFAMSKLRIELQQLYTRAISAAEKTRDAMIEEYEDDEDQVQQLQRAQATMNSKISALKTDLMDQLDAVTDVEPDKRPRFASAVRKQVDSYLDFLKSDEVMANLDGNEFFPETDVVEPLKSKLSQIAELLENISA